MDYNV